MLHDLLLYELQISSKSAIYLYLPQNSDKNVMYTNPRK